MSAVSAVRSLSRLSRPWLGRTGTSQERGSSKETEFWDGLTNPALTGEEEPTPAPAPSSDTNGSDSTVVEVIGSEKYKV